MEVALPRAEDYVKRAVEHINVPRIARDVLLLFQLVAKVLAVGAFA